MGRTRASPICAAALVPALAGTLLALVLVGGSAYARSLPSCPVGITRLPCADLAAGRLTAKVIDDGRLLELTGSATNEGTASTPATTLQVTIGTHALPEEPLQALAVKETASLTLHEKIPVEVRGTGQRITLTLDPEDTVTEATRDNNTGTTKASFPALPDLTLDNPTLRVENGDSIVADVTVLNQGTADDTISTTLTAAGAGVSNTQTVSPLAQGASQRVTVTLAVPPSARVGDVSVTLTIDQADVLAEQDEDNNAVTPPPVTIAPDLALATVTPTVSGRAVTLVVTVRNDGNTTAPATTLEARSPGWKTVTQRIDALAAGASVDTTLPLTAPPSAVGNDAEITVVVHHVPGDETDNNTSVVPVHVAALPAPDLYISSIRPTRNGRALTLTVEVGNAGVVRSGTTRAHASAPDWDSAAESVRALASGATTRVPLVLTIPDSALGRRVELLVTVDPVSGDPRVNNAKRITIKIPKPVPDVAVSGLNAHRDGQDVIVDAEVANVGAAVAHPIRLELRASGWSPRERTLDVLAAGQKRPVEFVLGVPAAATGTTATFRLRADPVPGERNVANNRAKTAFPVPPSPAPNRWWPYVLAGIAALLAGSLGVVLTLRGRRLRLRLRWQEEAEGERPETCEVPQSHVLQGEGKPKPAFRKIEKLGLATRGEDDEEERTSVDGAIVDILNRALWAHRLRRHNRVRRLVEPLGERLAAEIERWLAEKDDVDVAVSAEIKGGKLEYEFTRSECVRDGDACHWEERQKWKGDVEDKVEQPVAAVHVPLEPRADRVRQLTAELVTLIGRVDVPRRVRAPEAMPLPRD